MSIANPPRFEALLPKFIERFVDGAKHKKYFQRFDLSKVATDKDGLSYCAPQPEQMTIEDWRCHFNAKFRSEAGFVKCSYAIRQTSEKLKWICWDCDSQPETDLIVNKIIPWHESHGFQYILEHSQPGRCHLWVFLDSVARALAEKFVDQIHGEIGSKPTEVFPFGSRRNNSIRIPRGYHWWLKGPGKITTWDGEEIDDTLDAMQAIVDIKLITEHDISSYLAGAPAVAYPVRTPQFSETRRRIRYLTANLPEPLPNMPADVKKVACNCLAYNRLMMGIKDDGMIDRPGGIYHDTGLKVSGLALYHDLRHSAGGSEVREGRDWWNEVAEDFRSRSAKSHQWNGDKKYQELWDKNSYSILISNCGTMEQTFNMCQGCPFKGRPGLKNPAQFIDGKQIQQNLVGQIKSVTPTEIRQTTFPAVHAKVLDAIDKRERVDILLASPLGSGKTHSADELAVKVARAEKSVLIAVPTADLAAEHKKRIEDAGVLCHVLLSHENMFSPSKNHQLKHEFPCPNYDAIQNAQRLGCAAKVRDKFCNGCPSRNECRFPNQYEKINDQDVRVVIIQHAHFKSPQAMKVLEQKQFSLLIVDEDFTDNCYTHLRPSKQDLELLKSLGYNWATKIANWLTQGGYPSGAPIHPKEPELEELHRRAGASKIDWNVVIEAYNHRERAGRTEGLRIIHPVPEVPVRLFTDATPPIEMVKIILNNENIEVFGSGEVLDIIRCHPDNKVVSVLDQSVAKRQLGFGKGSDDFDEKFYDSLNFIGDKCIADHKDERVLITTYKSHINETIKYLKEKFPDLDVGSTLTNKIVVHHMQKGVNTYKNFHVQFLLAGVHPSGQDLLRKSYQLRSVQNHWRQCAGLPNINNIFPIQAFDGTNNPGLDMHPKCVRKTEPGGIYEYPDFTVTVPHFDIDRIVHAHAIAKGLQAMRLRFTENMSKPIVIYDFGNEEKLGLMVTHVLCFNDLVG